MQDISLEQLVKVWRTKIPPPDLQSGAFNSFVELPTDVGTITGFIFWHKTELKYQFLWIEYYGKGKVRIPEIISIPAPQYRLFSKRILEVFGVDSLPNIKEDRTETEIVLPESLSWMEPQTVPIKT